MNSIEAPHINLMVKAIWSDVLGISIDNESDNFFSLGGSSMQAFDIVSRISQSFKIELTIIDFFETLTIQGLAELIGSRLLAHS